MVVTDHRKRQGGKSLELVGFFNPMARGKDTSIRLDLPRIDHWVRKGAQQSERVGALVKAYRKQAGCRGRLSRLMAAPQAAEPC